MTSRGVAGSESQDHLAVDLHVHGPPRLALFRVGDAGFGCGRLTVGLQSHLRPQCGPEQIL